MNQTLHIFRKDTRHFWPEILISVVITATFIVHYPSQWRPYLDQNHRQLLAELTDAIGVLMLTSWWLLITRVIHNETIVGNQQFWITRPYEWKKLLAAKYLFLAVWVAGPYLLMQHILLAEAGFHPFSYVPGLLLNLFVFSAILFLPLFSIAAVTSTFARTTLTLLGCLALFTGYSLLINTRRGYTAASPYSDPFIHPLLFFGCAAIIALLYKTRKVWLSRALLIALPALVAVTVSVYRSQSMVDRGYPQPNPASVPPLRATLAAGSHFPVQARSWQGEDYIDLPILYSGVPDGYAVFADNFRFSLAAADGSQWTSPWQQLHRSILPGSHGDRLSLMISPALFDRFKSAPVTLQVNFAVSRFKSGTVTNMAFPYQDVPVPGIGFCSPQFYQVSTLYCRSALREPPLTYATAMGANSTCTGDAPVNGAGTPGSGWMIPNDPDFALTSVWVQPLWLNEDGNYDRHWRLCPGAPITFTQYHLVDRTQAALTLPNFQLPTVRRTDPGY